MRVEFLPLIHIDKLDVDFLLTLQPFLLQLVDAAVGLVSFFGFAVLNYEGSGMIGHFDVNTIDSVYFDVLSEGLSQVQELLGYFFNDFTVLWQVVFTELVLGLVKDFLWDGLL